MVLNEYLSTMEGPFWKEIRGLGLAYSCSLGASVEQGIPEKTSHRGPHRSLGFIKFTVYRAADSFLAYKAAQKVVHELKGFDLALVDSAKSSVVYGIISKEATGLQAGSQKFVNRVFRGGLDARKLIEDIQKVTVADMEGVLAKYVRNLFEAKTSDCAVVAAPTKFKVIA